METKITGERTTKLDTDQVNNPDSNRSNFGSRFDQTTKYLEISVKLQQELHAWLEGYVVHQTELHKAQDTRLTGMEERLAANAESQSKLDNEHQQRMDKIEETLTRITTAIEQREKLEDERQARVDEITRTVNASSEAITRIATIIEQREKLEDERQARVDEITRTVSASSEAITRIATTIEQREKLEDERQARVDKITDTVTTLSQTIAELKGMLTPWKIILGGIVSVSLATVLSVAAVKAVEALLKLVPG